MTDKTYMFSELIEKDQLYWYQRFTFQLKMLTIHHQNLLRNNDPGFIKTFQFRHPDIPLNEMNESESSEKYSFARCRQRSVTLTRSQRAIKWKKYD